MKFKDILKNTTWLRIENKLLELYPDEKNNISGYEKVYNDLLLMKPKSQNISIVLSLHTDEFDNTEYVDVSGKNNFPEEDNNEHTFSLALEFAAWREWLGMDIEEDTLQNFSKLEIIAHCLYEMTFVSFEEDEIQDKLKNLEKEVEDIKNMTEEEKKENLTSLDDFLKDLDDEEENDDE